MLSDMFVALHITLWVAWRPYGDSLHRNCLLIFISSQCHLVSHKRWSQNCAAEHQHHNTRFNSTSHYVGGKTKTIRTAKKERLMKDIISKTTPSQIYKQATRCKMLPGAGRCSSTVPIAFPNSARPILDNIAVPAHPTAAKMLGAFEPQEPCQLCHCCLKTPPARV